MDKALHRAKTAVKALPNTGQSIIKARNRDMWASGVRAVSRLTRRVEINNLAVWRQRFSLTAGVGTGPRLGGTVLGVMRQNGLR